MKVNLKVFSVFIMVSVGIIATAGCGNSLAKDSSIASNISLSKSNSSQGSSESQATSNILSTNPSSDLISSDRSSSTSSSKSGISSKANSAVITNKPVVSSLASVNLNTISSTPAIINAMIAFYDGKKVYKASKYAENTAFAYYRPDGKVLVSNLSTSYNSMPGYLALCNNNVLYSSTGVGTNIFTRNNLVLYVNHTTPTMESYSPPYLYKVNLDGTGNKRFTGWYFYDAFLSGDYIYANALNDEYGMLIPPTINSDTKTTAIRVNINDFSCKVFGTDIKFIEQDSCFTNDNYVLYTKASNRNELFLLENKTAKSIKITGKGYSMVSIINGYLLYQDEINDVRAIALADCGKKTAVVISKNPSYKKTAAATWPNLADEYFCDTDHMVLNDAFFNGGYTCRYFNIASGKEMKVVLFSGKSFIIKNANTLMPLFAVGDYLYFYKTQARTIYDGPGPYLSDIVAYSIKTGLLITNPGIETVVDTMVR